ncbi:MAG: hypothetical protein Q4D90_05180 [bacterium]|nr:hypothetical protein [bacterium]
MHRGKGKEERAEIGGNMLAGQDLVVAGRIAQTGLKKAAAQSMELLSTRFTASYIKSAVQVTALLPKEDKIWRQAGADALLFAGEGGIFACLWELASLFQKGFTVELQQIPVRQSTIELCEVMGLNPYRLESGECALFTADNGQDAARFLRERGIEAAWIGKVDKGISCRILNDGKQGFLERPTRDEMYKVIKTT